MGGQPIDSVLRGLQPIHIAASQSDPAVVEMLVQSGADINARSLSPPLHDEDRAYEIGSARTGGQSQRGIKSWSGRGLPKETALGNISSPLSCTAGLYSMETTHGENRGAARAGSACCEYGGATPLHFAVANGRLGCADVLIRSGASLDVADSYGNTPQDIAVARGDTVIATMLQQGRESLASVLSLDTSESSGLASLVAYPYDPVVSGYASLAEPLSKCATTVPQLPSPCSSILCQADRSPTPLQPLLCASTMPSPVTMPVPGRLEKGRRQAAWHSAPRKGVPARRHTTGEVESSARYAYVSPSPTTLSWLKAKHRGTSPIGIRSLSASAGQHRRPGRSASASGRLVNKDSGDDPCRAVAAANILNPGYTGTAVLYDSRRIDRYGRRARLAAATGESEYLGGGCTVGRSDSASSRRERSYTDSVLEKAWRSYLEHDDGGTAHAFAVGDASVEDDSLQPVPEPWMWKQAAMAVRNRRSQSLSAKIQQQQQQQKQKQHSPPPRPAPARHKRLGRLL
ncbi:hypothetical protein GGI20_001387 [Coemansia sp. BCRC 34301]|nr:hypothetical protein GGI20_001387 [Coemansia sp. BCRC 34301]